MTTAQTVWLVIAVAVVLIVIGVAVWASRRRSAVRVEHDRERATLLRQDAEQHSVEARESEIRSHEAELDAERARLDAERAEAQAVEARRGLEMDQAHVEDRMREADRIDPDGRNPR